MREEKEDDAKEGNDVVGILRSDQSTLLMTESWLAVGWSLGGE